MWDKNKAVEHLRNHAHTGSTGQCAKYVREAIEAGGITVHHTHSAKDYGAQLKTAGFTEIADSSFLQPGDVAVIQPIPGHPHGHMAMYDGGIWISDFRQYHGFYPGQSWRSQKPPYIFYRYP
ncbi:hypothetical protein [Pantoea sp. B65]|uniref:hypothetical protein n=1 Tax=Pantoea sp. B65 TaxID=2813359 RepID=UPI0039B46EBE